MTPGRPATSVAAALESLSTSSLLRTGTRPGLPTPGLLGERAAMAGFSRQGPWSCGGSFRALPTLDGWFGLSLARADDLALVPALVSGSVGDDVWSAAERWAARVTTTDAVERAQLLGLASSAITEAPVRERERDPVLVSSGSSRRTPEHPRIVDLTSLWAGPLCAHLLGLAGAVVVKVESSRRPDGARNGPRDFFDLLHHGHTMLSLDFASDAGRAELRHVIETADLVLEASRPRALRQLGIDAEEMVDSGVSWLSITARGRASNTIGFGDDVAAGAGFFVLDQGEILPLGDALADPLTGVVAAAAASEALVVDHARLIDVSMHDVCVAAAEGSAEPHAVTRSGDHWWVDGESGRFLVQPPQGRR
jgi:hypothetical protein